MAPVLSLLQFPPPPIDTAPFLNGSSIFSQPWQRWFLALSRAFQIAVAPGDAPFVITQANASLSTATNLGLLSTGYVRIATALGVATVSTVATVPTTDLSGVLQAAQFPALSGDVTTVAGALATTIGANKVTNAMLAQVSTATFKGRTTAATGNVEDLTVAQATALLNVFVGDAGAGGTKGLVIAPAIGDATKFLRGDATWATVTTASVTSVSVVSANGFSGTVANATTTPAITVTTTITGILKGNATAISAATVGTDYSVGTSALGTGILKSTTTTGALSIAIAADFPTLNQNTSGSAATLTTPRTIAGVSFNGSANIAIASTGLSDTANIAYLNAATNAFTGKAQFGGAPTFGTPEVTMVQAGVGVITNAHQLINSSTPETNGQGVGMWFLGSANWLAKIDAVFDNAASGNSSLHFYTANGGTITDGMKLDTTGTLSYKLSANFSWVSKSVSTVYQAASDGFFLFGMVATTSAYGSWEGVSDSNPSPSTVRFRVGPTINLLGTTYWSGMSPVKKGDYYSMLNVGDGIGGGAASTFMWWVPLGTAG